MTAEEVQKYLKLAQELATLAGVFLPDDSGAKKWVDKAKDVLVTPSLTAVVVDGFKLYEEVKAIVAK